MNLEQRIAALETMTAELAATAGRARTSARRWRTAAIATGLALVGGIGIAAGNATEVMDEVEAESITIVNEDGDPVIELGSDGTGGIIRLMNNDGDVVGQWEVYDTGGYLSIRNPGEDEMAVIRCDDFGGIFAAMNADGGRAASMEVDGAGGIITVRSSSDEQVGVMLDIIDNAGRVYVNDGEGGEREIQP